MSDVDVLGEVEDIHRKEQFSRCIMTKKRVNLFILFFSRILGTNWFIAFFIWIKFPGIVQALLILIVGKPMHFIALKQHNY